MEWALSDWDSHSFACLGLKVVESSLFTFDFYLTCMGVLPACMWLHHTYTWCLRRPSGLSGPLELETQMVARHHVGVEWGT